MIKYLNILFLAGMVVMNYLANALPINGKTTGQLSDAFPNLFVPAGITFSIWGVIYLLLIAFCVVQFSASNQQIISNISWLFMVSCVLNALWIVCWHYGKIPLSVIVMIGLLVTLIYINMQIRNLPSGIIKASFGIYLGWICIATIANVTALLVHYHWNGSGISHEIWTIVLIIAGMLIVAMAITRFKNPFIGLSVIWAFAGIMIKRQSDYISIVIVAGLAAVLIAILVTLTFLRKQAPGLG